MKWFLLPLVCAGILTAAEPARPRIVGVPHIALFVKDFDASRAFYRQFLGFRAPHSIEGPDGKPAVTYVKINDRQYIELRPEHTPASDRLSHISLETDNAEGMRVYLKSRGVTVPDGLTIDPIGNLTFDIKDPEGHIVRFLQFQPSGWMPRNEGKYMSRDRIAKRMMHVGIIVTDLDPEMKFYKDVLGFREFWRGSSSGTQLSWINLRVPDGEDYIELMLYKEPPAPTARGGAHHMCLEVPDIGASLAALEKRPYRQSYTRPLEARVGRNRKRQLNIFDPDGTRTELMEPVTIDGEPAPSSDAPPPND